MIVWLLNFFNFYSAAKGKEKIKKELEKLKSHSELKMKVVDAYEHRIAKLQDRALEVRDQAKDAKVVADKISTVVESL